MNSCCSLAADVVWVMLPSLQNAVQQPHMTQTVTVHTIHPQPNPDASDVQDNSGTKPRFLHSDVWDNTMCKQAKISAKINHLDWITTEIRRHLTSSKDVFVSKITQKVMNWSLTTSWATEQVIKVCWYSGSWWDFDLPKPRHAEHKSTYYFT